MKIFTCSSCKEVVFFENSACTHCGSKLGFLPDVAVVSALEPSPENSDVLVALSDAASGARYRLCANYRERDACNWLVAEHEETQAFCVACRLDQVIPDLTDASAFDAWLQLERAKRRLIYSLLALRLPIDRLAFAFKRNIGVTEVISGHSQGLVTINIAEADSVYREKMRLQLGESYRTLLGHLRHEIGHYYWDQLVQDSKWHEPFRDVFGDERADYGDELTRHYRDGAPADWQKHYVSAYSSMHPWEDWAETFAHYLHMIDTLETAHSYGLTLRPSPVDGTKRAPIAARDVPQDGFGHLIATWFSVTVALNSFNRGMGLPDLYPFVLGDRAVAKLRFVHRLLGEVATPAAPAAPPTCVPPPA